LNELVPMKVQVTSALPLSAKGAPSVRPLASIMTFEMATAVETVWNGYPVVTVVPVP
jgi:hypothetical protein